MDNANDDGSTTNEMLDNHCDTFHLSHNAFLSVPFYLLVTILLCMDGVKSLRDGSRALRRSRSAIPSIGQVVSYRRNQPSQNAKVDYFVTLKFPFSMASQYLPPDSTIPPSLESVVAPPSNDTPNDGIAWEYRVSWKEHQEAVETGQLTMVFDPGRPGIEIPSSVHNYNSYFWWAFCYLTLSFLNCCFFIGWLISLFNNEDWCGLAEYILLFFLSFLVQQFAFITVGLIPTARQQCHLKHCFLQ